MTLIQPNYKKRMAKLDESPLTPFYSVKFNFTPKEEYQYPSGFYGIEWTDAIHKLCVRTISTTKFIGTDTDTGMSLSNRLFYLWNQDDSGNIVSLEMKSPSPFSEGEFELMRDFSELWTVSGKYATIQMSDVSPYEEFSGTKFKTETPLLLYTNPRSDRDTGKPLLHRGCEGQVINTLLFFFHKDTSIRPQKLFMESFVKDEETNWVTGIIPADRNPYGKDMFVKVRVSSVIKKTVQTRGSRCSPFPFSFHIDLETEFPIIDCYGLGFSNHFGSGRLKLVEEFS